MSNCEGSRSTPPSAEEVVREEVMAGIAMASRDVLKAKVTIFVIRPLMHLLTMVYAAGLLYAATWVVVLALRHSGAIS